MNKILQQRAPLVDSAALSDDIHPLLRRIYALRGIRSSDELERSASGLLNYKQLNGIDNAVDVLYQSLSQQQRIMVVGDFDTDGATSTALMVKALRYMGAKFVDYIVPDRFEDGYGLGINVVKRAIEQKAELIITVDNGISSFEGVDFAHAHGLKVIITDHHLPALTLPDADAIINPNLSNCTFPSKNLAGVGIAFYFMLALRAHLRQMDWFSKNQLAETNLANLLDLVALGTVADVVVLDNNNRILVHQGLSRIRSGYCCAGIKAMLDIAKKDQSKLTTTDLSFTLAPRLNAAGRMETMSLGIELLLCEDYAKATEMATELDALNSTRRDVEQSMQIEAMAFVQQIETTLQEIPSSLVIYHPEWHQGVIGILSARIKDKFYRPVISFAAAGNNQLKGSGRSIPGFHLRDALERLDTLYPDLIMCFGGHAMAAGLTIEEHKLDIFKQRFEQLTSEMIDEAMLNNIVLSDGPLDKDWFNCETAKVLQEGGPWGQGFPEPMFDGEFKLHQQRIVGDKHLKIVIEPADGGPLIEGIAFNVDTLQWPDLSIKRIKLAYNLDINDFRGNQNVQLLVRHLWPVA
ncbi:single-stranded-DNA-specific exonuclease RecJ [Zophobihabitans entericus]|uniref:Single-stranded-DNA-specific exonuclease RecJ n=1 Tax=Zophobihabitans entericus TaxID=1635327 RepID=A0A6G9I874_9GAMM|nr:single-stranded-DNA-specific exonuclease RecJ [Zophobihabitans entericus]QIQ20411.1 single-stranded-DNA-specific exonuclease RecJ [Zophobihabitans entericus]